MAYENEKPYPLQYQSVKSFDIHDSIIIFSVPIDKITDYNKEMKGLKSSANSKVLILGLNINDEDGIRNF